MTETENNHLIEEIAGKPSEGIPMTPTQEFYLANVLDPYIQHLIDDMELERVRHKLEDEKLRKTYL